MHTPRDEELVLYYYGEARNTEAIRRKLAASPTLRAQYEELCRVLGAVEALPTATPPEDYGARVWRHLSPRLMEEPARNHWGVWFLKMFATPRRLVWAGGFAALLMVAFFAGRYLPRASVPETATAVAERSGGDRVVLVTIGRHLERSEMLLLELVNAEDSQAPGTDLHQAEELLRSNRLYRQAASQSGEEGVEQLLKELERLLLELAHEDLSGEDLSALRRRIDDGGMLFRMRILSTRIERHASRGDERKTFPRSEIPGEV